MGFGGGWLVVVIVALAGLVAVVGSARVADEVTLRDGGVALGQVVEGGGRGQRLLLIRREWARENLPEWAKRWEAAEAPQVRQGRAQRRARLVEWQRERREEPDPDNPIDPWIAQEVERLTGEAGPVEAPLLLVDLKRGDVKRLKKQPEEVGRLLRLGWRMGFADVEEMSPEELSRALEGRGFAPGVSDPAPVDDLLPLLPEAEPRWLAQRAATEVQYDRGLRFIGYQGLVLPENQPGTPADPGAVLGVLKGLLGEPDPIDPFQARLREVEARGRIGAMMTRLDLAEDGSTVKVEATLWVRTGPDRWAPALSFPAVVRPDQVRPDDPAADRIAADPQVQTAFGAVEALGLGTVSPEARGLGLRVGVATQTALGQAQGLLVRNLQGLVLPVTERARERPASVRKAGDPAGQP